MSLDFDRDERIEEVFAEAVALTPTLRGRLLDRECLGDESLRAEVERLLAADDHMSGLQEGYLGASSLSVSNLLADPLHDPFVGRKLGSYVVEKRIDVGGFGNVYLATRAEPFEQQVAVKLLNTDHSTRKDIVSRFLLERQVLAGLSHDNIARLIDGGCTDDGVPYLIMEYVDGVSIAKYCDHHQLDLDSRLKLFMTVCGAVTYAHRMGVIHRDIKPQNILVTESGVPKLIDFGVVKIIESDSRTSPLLTKTNLAPLTPQFASPEQLRGEIITTQSDIYSLGVVLYLLLTGRHPYDLKQNYSPASVVTAVCDTEPPQPSDIVRNLSSRENTQGDTDDAWPTYESPETLRRKLKGDLDSIVMMAMQKEPSRRYASVQELTDDISRHLTSLPIRARRDTIGYLASKWIHRHRTISAAVVVFVISVAIGLAAASIAFNEAIRQRTIAEGRLHELQRIAYNRGLSHVSSSWYKDASLAPGLLDETRFPPGLRDFTWRLYRKNARREFLDFAEHTDAVHAVAFSPDGKRVASAGKDAVIRIWEAATGREIAILKGHVGWVNSLAFSPDGKMLGSASEDGSIRLWDPAESGELMTFSGHSDSVSGLAFSPDGRKLATASYDGSIRIWDSQTGEMKHELNGHDGPVLCVAFSPDEQLLASGGKDRVVRIWELSDFSERAALVGHEQDHDWVLSLAFSPDGRRLASSGWNATIQLWDVRLAQLEDTVTRPGMTGHSRPIRSVAFSPDGRVLVSAGEDMSIILWEVDSKRIITRFRDHRGFVRQVSFAPDGQFLASAGYDGLVKLWRVGEDLSETISVSNADHVFALAWSNQRELCTSTNGRIDVWNADTMQRLCSRQLDGGHVRTVAYSKDGQMLASGSDDGVVRLWRASDLQQIKKFKGHTGRVQKILFCDDKQSLISASIDSSIRIWDLATSSERLLLSAHEGRIRGLSVSADGSTLASSDDQSIRIWDLDSGELLRLIRDHGPANWLQYSPDGASLVIVPLDLERRGHVRPRVLLLDAMTYKTVATMFGHREPVLSVAFSSDGKTIASGGADTEIRLWDAKTGNERAVLTGHSNRVSDVKFSADGRTLASASHDGTAKLWKADPLQMNTVRSAGREIARLRAGSTFVGQGIDVRHRFSLRNTRYGITSLAVSPDSSLLAAGYADGSATVWDGEEGDIVRSFDGHSDPLRVDFSPDGESLLTAGGHLSIWDLANGERLAKSTGTQVAAAVFSGRGDLIAATRPESVQVLNARTLEPVREL